MRQLKKDSLTPADLAVAIEIYVSIGIPLDKLAFDPEFDRLHHDLESRIMRQISKANLWQELQNARKAKKLPQLVRKKESASGDIGTGN